VSRVWVFDVDDTLYLERDYVQSGLRAVAAWAEREFGVGGVYEAAWGRFLAGSRSTTLTDVFAAAGRPLDVDETAAAVSAYREHQPDIRLCKDAEVLLEALVSSAPVGIITDGPASSQRAKLRALGLESMANLIVVTDEHGPGWHKPRLRAFQHIQTSFCVDPSHCVYVADNPAKDFTGPKSLGWATVRIARPLGLHADALAEQTEVDVTVTTLTALIVDTQVTGER